jgi:hypothetical protein
LTSLISQGIHVLVIDVLPPSRCDPERVHGAIWTACGNAPSQLPAAQPLTLASYTGGASHVAYVEAVAGGDVLPDMPLFLLPDWYVNVPLERTYEQTWRGLPAVWREALTGTSG